MAETDSIKLSPEEVAKLLAEESDQNVEPLSPEQVAEITGAPAQPPAQRQPVLRLPFGGKPSAALDTFALRGADAVPAGGMISDLLGTGILQAAKRLGMGEPGALLTPQAQAELYQLATQEGLSPEEAEAQIRDPGNPIGGMGDTYRLLRDTRRADTASLSKENPWSGRIGEGLGTVATLLAPLPGFKAGKGAGTLARIGAGAATGAGYGALSGFTNGEADLSRGDVRGTARDVADNALGGAAVGAGIGALSEGASKAWPWLRRYSINKGREVLGGSSDIGAATRKPLPDDAVEEVLASGGIRPFDNTMQTHERVAQLADEAGAMYGGLVADLEAAGVRGPEARTLARSWMDKYEAAFNNSSADKGPANVFREEANNVRALSRGGKTLGLSQAEGIKRSLQKRGKFFRREANPMEDAVQEASSDIRQAVEDAVSQAGARSTNPEVQSLANAFTPVKQRAARLLNAEEFTDRAASKFAQKPAVGFMDRVVGAGTSGGNLLQAEANARLMSSARRRLPSALSRYAYDLSQGMETGAVTPALSKGASLAFSPPATDSYQAFLDWLLAPKDSTEGRLQALERQRKDTP